MSKVMFRHWPVSRKLFAGFMVVLFLFVASTGSALFLLKQSSRLMTEREGTVATVQALAEMRYWVQRQNISQLRLIENNDAAYIDDYQKAVDNMDRLRDAARKKGNSAVAEPIWEELYALDAGTDAAFFEQIVPAWRLGDAGGLVAAQTRFNQQQAQMNDTITRLVDLYQGASEEAALRLHRKVQQVQVTTVTLTAIAIFLGLTISFFIARSITRPLNAVLEKVRLVAGGDLTVVLQAGSRDEVGQLATGVAAMVAGMRRAIEEIISSTAQVNETSHQLDRNAREAVGATSQVADAVGQMAEGMGQQSSYAEKTVAAVAQLQAAISQIAAGAEEQARKATEGSETIVRMARLSEDAAGNSIQVADAVHAAEHAAKAGEQVVRDAIGNMETLRQTIVDLSGRVAELNARAGHIGAIIQVIDNIAEQTNLLALNAAIEAARAGEYGKGFAVVAEEVRKLAERAGKATRESSELLLAIQEETSLAARAMAASVEAVNTNLNQTRDTGVSFSQVREAVQRSCKAVHLIRKANEEMARMSADMVPAMETLAGIAEENSAATGEMVSGSNHVSAAMENVAAVAQQGAASAQEVSASSQQLNASAEEVARSASILEDLAGKLTGVVAAFQV